METHTDDPTPAQAFVFRLLAFPPEIRNKIYSLAMETHETIRIADNHPTPALLCTCRQIQTEAEGFYYSTNTFCMRKERFARWLASRKSSTRALIRSVRLLQSFEGFKSSPKDYDYSGPQGFTGLGNRLEWHGLSSDVKIEVGVIGAGSIVWLCERDWARLPSSTQRTRD